MLCDDDQEMVLLRRVIVTPSSLFAYIFSYCRAGFASGGWQMGWLDCPCAPGYADSGKSDRCILDARR